MAFLSFDIYGNPGPGTDYAPLTTSFAALTPAQQIARFDFLQHEGLLPSQKPLTHELFTSHNVDAWYNLIGGPKPDHSPSLGKKIAETEASILGSINPLGKALTKVALDIKDQFSRPAQTFYETSFTKYDPIQTRDPGGTGGGVLGYALGLGSALVVRKNPKLRPLLADSQSLLGALLTL